MEQDSESIYDLPPSTSGKTNPKFDSKGSYHPVRECNMLHLSDNGVAAAEGGEDDAYLIPCTLGEQEEYEQERLEQARVREAKHANERHDNGCPSLQHLDVEGARAHACRVYEQT